MYINYVPVDGPPQDLAEGPDTRTAAFQLLWIALAWLYSKLPVLVPSVQHVFSVPPTWPLQALVTLHEMVLLHPYPHFVAVGIVFFGPISFAIPLVVVQDLVIQFLLYTVYLFHGLIPVRNLARYYHSTNALAFAPSVCRLEAVFASLEHAASVYNEWTTNHMPLLLARLLAAAACVYILIGLAFLWP
ncbi:hypothetical protein PM082_016722 [Marasmius tenuissimus]|nr:hypothetical protein PM082_016722 [Marasmius tenuissimus]